MARYGRLLTDAQWKKIRPLLPKRPKRPKGGAPAARQRGSVRHSVKAAGIRMFAGPH